MPKTDPKVRERERRLQLMLEHVSEYPDPTAAAEGSPSATAWARRPCDGSLTRTTPRPSTRARAASMPASGE